MTFKEKDIALMAWVATLTESTGDFLCILAALEDGTLLAEYRFRYTNNPDEFDPADRVSRYTIGPGPDSPENREKLIGAIRLMMSKPGFSNVRELEINGSGTFLILALQNLPGLMLKMAKTEITQEPTKPEIH